MPDAPLLNPVSPCFRWQGPGLELALESGLEVVRLCLGRQESPDRAAQVLGGALPSARTIVWCRTVEIAWLGPREWLLMGRDLTPVIGGLRDAYADGLALVTDVTHASASFVLSGPSARAALSAHCPLDIADHAFPKGVSARSLLGEAGVFVARLPDGEAGHPCFRLIVDQTLADYAVRMIRPREGVI